MAGDGWSTTMITGLLLIFSVRSRLPADAGVLDS